MKLTLKDIAYNGVLAALYFVLTLLTYAVSFGPIQFRIAEILILLVFFRKDYTLGLTLGCFLSNLFSSATPFDALFGTLATFLSCLLIAYSKILLVAIIYPTIINGLVVGLELLIFTEQEMGFYLYASSIALGELAVLILGYILFQILRHHPRFLSFIRARQNIAFKL